MTKERLLAYTDAIIAIIITIMVLEFKTPHSDEWWALYELRHIFMAYILSFVFLSIYWNNHHHTFQLIEKVNWKTLWINNLLIFFLSLIPFTTAWMAENHFASNTIIAYGIILLACALSYTLLIMNLLSTHGEHSHFARAIGSDRKWKISLFLYIFGIISAFWVPIIGTITYAIVAIIWLIPDKRIEKVYAEIK